MVRQNIVTAPHILNLSVEQVSKLRIYRGVEQWHKTDDSLCREVWSNESKDEPTVAIVRFVLVLHNEHAAQTNQGLVAGIYKKGTQMCVFMVFMSRCWEIFYSVECPGWTEKTLVLWVCVSQCRWDWRPTATWCHRCTLASSGKEPAYLRSAASCRCTRCGYGSLLSPLLGTPHLHLLRRRGEEGCEVVRGVWNVVSWSLFFVLHTKINDFTLDKGNILEFIFDPLASKIHQEESWKLNLI